MKLTGKRCLVTGGAGFIGSHLVDNLVQRGCKVRILDNLANGKLENIEHQLRPKHVEFILGSITDPFDVNESMQDIDVVFHLACLGVRHSLVHPFENHRVNAEGSLLVLEAARRNRVKRFLYCSSSEVYGTAEYVPMPETHPTHPCTVYGSSKLAGEAYARAYYKTFTLPIIIVRPFNTFGPRSHHEGDSGELIPKSIVRALNDNPIMIFGNGSQTRDFTYVEDTADAISQALECDALIGQTVNIGSNFEISIKEIASKINKLVGRSQEKVIYTGDRPGDVFRLYADPQKFLETCNWRPRMSFQDGLVETIEYFRSHPRGFKTLICDERGRSWETNSQ